MPIICWGNLAKSADDTLRIEQSIQDYVEGHDENPNAHMGPDYSLGAHRLLTELDHAFGSVSLKHIVSDKVVFFTGFESKDGWDTEGTVNIGVLGTTLTSAATIGAVARIKQEGLVGASQTDYTKNPFFQTTIKCLNSTNQTIFIVRGANPYQGDGDCFGFKVFGGTLYAFWMSSYEEYEVMIAGITITDDNVYRAYCDSATSKIYFYVNGVLKYTAESNYPVELSTYIVDLYIESESNNTRTFQVCDLLIEQDR